MSVVRFRTWPPLFKANCSQLALLFLDFPRTMRGVGLICVRWAVYMTCVKKLVQEK